MGRYKNLPKLFNNICAENVGDIDGGYLLTLANADTCFVSGQIALREQRGLDLTICICWVAGH